MGAMKSLFQKVTTTSLRETIRRVAGLGGSRASKATALGMGVTLGLLPLVPFQTPLALFFAFLFRLNRIAALVGTLVCQPFTAPFIWGAEYVVGCWFTGRQPADISSFPRDLSQFLTWGKSLLFPLTVGSVVISLAGGTLVGLISYFFMKPDNRQKSDSSVYESEESS